MLSNNYITRAWHDDGQFSEPIMYRNLYLSYLEEVALPKTKDKKRETKWYDENCVS